MGTLTLERKKRRRRIIVKDRVTIQHPKPKKKKHTPTKKQLQKAENKRILEERKKRAAENIEKQAEIKLAKRMAVRKLNKKLKANYSTWNDNLPLPVGVDKVIFELGKGDLSNKAMRDLIGNHCKKRLYLENMVKLKKRYSLLTGEVVAEINSDAVANAERIIERFNELSGKKH